MITEKELTDIIKATLNRSIRTYNSPSGAFLEIIRGFASEERIDDIAEAIKIYTEIHPQTDKFIAASLPAILSNCYFTVLQDFPFEKFIEWSVLNTEWSNWIKENHKNKNGLASSVQKITQEVKDFKSGE